MQLIWRDVAIGDGPPINTSLTSAETTELQRLAKDADVLEVGTAYGYSTVALALVANHVTAVDPHLTHGSYGDVLANLDAYGVTATIVRDYSQIALPALHGAGMRYDLVWIDGDHTAEGVEHDVTWAIKLLKPGGVIACHDYDEVTCPGVRVALDKLFGGAGQLIDTLSIYRGRALPVAMDGPAPHTTGMTTATAFQVRPGVVAWTLQVGTDLFVEVDADDRVLGVMRTSGKIDENDLWKVLNAVTVVRPDEG